MAYLSHVLTLGLLGASLSPSLGILHMTWDYQNWYYVLYAPGSQEVASGQLKAILRPSSVTSAVVYCSKPVTGLVQTQGVEEIGSKF